MAAKKTTPKPAPHKGKAKPAVKPSKPLPAAKKPLAKAAQKPAPAVKKAAPKTVKKGATAPTVKKAMPVKKAVFVKKTVAAQKALPVEKAASVEKKVVEKLVNKVSPPAKEIAKPAKTPKAVTVEPVKVEAQVKASPAKKVPVTKPRSSVVDFPAPPAPVRPPFVPPKAAPTHSDGPVTPGSNGTHSVAFVQKQRQRLLDLRDDLVDAVSGMARDTIRNAPEGSEASGSGQHQGDAGSDAYDRDFALSVLAKEQDALYEIEQALYRIKQGSYGICEMSARKIPQARLEAIPFARLTVECQGQWEKEYGNRRFRPSNEVGFSGGKYAEDEDSETVSLDEDDD